MVGITHHAPLTSTHNYLAGSAEDTVYETDMPTVGAGQQFIEQFASVRWLCPKYFRQKRFFKGLHNRRRRWLRSHFDRFCFVFYPTKVEGQSWAQDLHCEPYDC